MNQSIDQAKPIRTGEELDSEKLLTYLNQTLQRDEKNISVLQFPSGFSNLTYFVQYGAEEYVLRRPPFGAEDIAKGHDMGREYKVLKAVYPFYSKIPKTLVYCEDKSVIGAPFYMMEKVTGVILRATQKIDLDAPTMRKLNENFIDNLADLHSLDIEKTGLSALGKVEGYLERQVEGWIGRYKKAQTDDIPDMEKAIEWFAKNLPTTKYNSMIHNDYKYDNVILDQNDITKIKAVLDWEMATVGDSFTDLATVLAYTTELSDPLNIRQFNIPIVPNGTLDRKEMLERYEQRMGIKVDNIVFYYAFAVFKLGVITQQIYYRFHKGYTKDQRFAAMIHMVKDCAKLSAAALVQNKIHHLSF